MGSVPLRLLPGPDTGKQVLAQLHHQGVVLVLPQADQTQLHIVRWHHGHRRHVVVRLKGGGAQGHALSADELSDLQARKTGALLSGACMLGAAAAGACDEDIDTASQYGAQLGAAFQIRDDMLDVLSTVGELGKPIGSDKRDGKTTFMSLYGEERCARMVEKITAQACATVAGMDTDGFLTALAKKMASRRG